MSRRARPSKVDVATLVVLGAHFLLKLVCFFHMKGALLTGDERSYARAAEAVGGILRLTIGSGSGSLDSQVLVFIDKGWFMRGPSLLLGSLTMFVPEPSLFAYRVWMGGITLLVLIWSLLEVRLGVGRFAALAVAVFIGLSPTWTMFSFALWGDLLGGLLFLVVAARITGWGRSVLESETTRISSLVVSGLILGAALHMRASVLPFVPLIFGLMIVLALFRRRQFSASARDLLAIVLGGLAFLAVLLPWSLLISKTFERPVITTTSLPIAVASAFGDKRNLCDGPCPGKGNSFLRSHAYYKNLARHTGRNILDIQGEMTSKALEGLTVRHYVSRLKGNFSRFLFQPNEFMSRFVSRVTKDGHETLVSRHVSLFNALTALLYTAGLVTLAAAFLWPSRRGIGTQILGLVVRVAILAAMAQPFVHVCTGRYWPIFAPIFGLAAAFLAEIALGGNRLGATSSPVSSLSGDAGDEGILSLGQLAISTITLLALLTAVLLPLLSDVH